VILRLHVFDSPSTSAASTRLVRLG